MAYLKQQLLTIPKGLALAFFALLMLAQQASASHIVGGDIRYRHVSGNDYEVTLGVYRDCFYAAPGAIFDDPVAIGVYDHNNMFIDSLLIPYTTDDTLNAVLNDPCLLIPDDVCVHVTFYVGVFTLPDLPAGGHYQMVYQRCCRNQTITNMIDPEETGQTYNVVLTEEAMDLENSAPFYDTIAPIFICIGEQIDFDHSATDYDDDDLVYRLCTPLEGASFGVPKPQPPFAPPYVPITFTGGYDETTFLGPTAQPLIIDAETGILSGLPEIYGQFVVGVCVDEFRDGELLSTVRRDFQYNVGDCTQIEAIADVPSVQCDDLTVNFINQSTESDNYIWDFDYPNGVLSTEVSPTYTYPDTGTYIVRLIAQPGVSCANTTDFEVYLQSNSIIADFNIDIYDCDNEAFLIVEDLSTDAVSPLIDWDWSLVYGNVNMTSDVQNPQFEVPLDVDGVLQLTVTSQNGCVRTFARVFSTGDNNPYDLITAEQSICDGEEIELNPNYDTTLNWTYQWSPADGLSCDDCPNPSASPDNTTNYSVTITAFDNLCTITEDVEVEVVALPMLAFTTQTDCDGVTVQFANQSTAAAGYMWSFGDPTTSSDESTDANPSYTYPNPGMYTVTLETMNGAECSGTITQEIEVVEHDLSAAFDFAYEDCSETSVTITFSDDSSNNLNNTDTYEWSFSDGQNAVVQHPTVTFTNEDDLTVTLLITTDEGCEATISQTLDIEFTDLGDLTLDEDILYCDEGDPVALNPGGNPTYTYEWSPADGLSSTTAANPFASPTQTTTYNVTVTNNNGADACILTESVTIFVPPVIGLEVPIGGDIVTCEDEITFSAGVDQNATITWFENGVQIFEGTTITIPVSGSNIYTVVATDEFGCTDTDTEATVEGGPVEIQAQGDAIICSDENLNVLVQNLDANDDLTYDWQPAANINGSNAVANPNVSGMPGIYTYTVDATSQFNCAASDTVEVVIVDENIDLDFTFLAECNGSTVNFTNTSADAFGYVWTFGDPTNPTATSVDENPSYNYPEPGTYTATLNIIYDVDCVVPVSYDVVIPDVLLFADFAYEYVNCEENEIEISFTDQSQNFQDNTTGWMWTFSNGETSNVQNPTITVSPDDAGDLTVSLLIMTANGCDATDEEVLNIEFIDVTSTIHAGETIRCHNDSIVLNPNGNTNYQYEWSPATGLSDVNAASPLAFPEMTTNYSVTITNSNGADECQIIREVEVFVPTEINLIAPVGSQIACDGPATLNVSTAVATLITWVDSDGTDYNGTSITVLPESELTYYMTATDAFGCMEMDSVTVTNGILELEVENDGEFFTCPTSEYQLLATATDPTDTVTWESIAGPGGTIDGGGDTPTPSVFSNFGEEVTFTVNATNQYGCTATETIDAFVPLPVDLELEAGANELTACDGEVTLSVTTIANVDVVWTDEDGTVYNEEIISVLPDSVLTYYVTATDEYGCTEMDSITVTNGVVELEVEGDGTFFSCPTEEYQLSATATDLTDIVTWEWTAATGGTIISGGNTNMPTVSSTNGEEVTFNVTATNQHGCSATESIIAFVPTPPNIDIDLEDIDDEFITCGEDVNLSITADVPDLMIEWTDEDGNIIAGDDITVLPNTSATYYVTAMDEYGCMENDSITIVNGNVDLMIMAESNTLVTCPVDDITFGMSTNDPTVTWEWTTDANGTILSGEDTSTITATTPLGVPTEFYVFASNDLGCSDADTVTVIMDAFVPAFEAEVEICPGIATPINPAGDTTIYDYLWLPATGLDNNTLPNPTATLTEDQTYMVIVSFESMLANCVDTVTVDVLVNEPIMLGVTEDQFHCEPMSETLTATANVPVDFIWATDIDFNDIISENGSVDVSPEGDVTYYVQATDALGCTAIEAVNIQSFPLDYNLEDEQVLCFGETGILNLGNADPLQTLTYDWSPLENIVTGATTSSPEVNPTESTMFYVTVENQIGCVAMDSIWVSVENVETSLFATADPDTITLGSGETSQLLTVEDPDYKYLWTPSETLDDGQIFNPIASPEETTEYTVFVTGPNGCEAERSVTVVVVDFNCDEPFIFLPSAFTPNGDGENDQLFVRGNNIEEVYLGIYNRWGQKVFETDDLSIGWDGMFKSKPLSPDVYGFYLQVKCFNGQDYFKKGNITLLR